MTRIVKSGPKVLQREVIVLGVIGEVKSYDISCMNYEAIEEVTDFLHAVGYVEMISRPLETMEDWSIRVKNMFLRNRLIYISDVLSLDLKQVNRLSGCGYKVRQEVYQVMGSYGCKVEAWMPGHYWERMNYKFTDD